MSESDTAHNDDDDDNNDEKQVEYASSFFIVEDIQEKPSNLDPFSAY